MPEAQTFGLGLGCCPLVSQELLPVQKALSTEEEHGSKRRISRLRRFADVCTNIEAEPLEKCLRFSDSGTG